MSIIKRCSICPLMIKLPVATQKIMYNPKNYPFCLKLNSFIANALDMPVFCPMRGKSVSWPVKV